MNMCCDGAYLIIRKCLNALFCGVRDGRKLRLWGCWSGCLEM